MVGQIQRAAGSLRCQRVEDVLQDVVDGGGPDAERYAGAGKPYQRADMGRVQRLVEDQQILFGKYLDVATEQSG